LHFFGFDEIQFICIYLRLLFINDKNGVVMMMMFLQKEKHLMDAQVSKLIFCERRRWVLITPIS